MVYERDGMMCVKMKSVILLGSGSDGTVGADDDMGM